LRTGSGDAGDQKNKRGERARKPFEALAALYDSVMAPAAVA
jgi:hypothetical protein